MIESTQGTVRASEGCINLVGQPTRPSSPADPTESEEVREILIFTGINMGPVEVEVKYLLSPPRDHPEEEFEEVWEDLRIDLPVGQLYLNGPGTSEILDLGRVESAATYAFRVFGNGSERMPDLVAEEVVQNYLIWAWVT